MKKMLCCYLIFLVAISGQGQEVGNDWIHIDTSIQYKKNIDEITRLLPALMQHAKKQGKYFDLARGYFYTVQLADMKSEDTVFFRNSAIFDSLLLENKVPIEMKTMLHVLLAMRIEKFCSKNLRFNKKMYELTALPINYAALSFAELRLIANNHYEQAKMLIKEDNDFSMKEFIWLSSDPLIFLFQPTLFDIVIAEQIRFLKKIDKWDAYHSPIIAETQKLSQDDFIKVLDTIGMTNSEQYSVLKLYREWMYTYKDNLDKIYFIETLVRKFIDTKISTRSQANDGSYEKYLIEISQSPIPMVRAYGVYQLCWLWESQSGMYFPYNSGDLISRNISPKKEYNKLVQYHAAHALKLYAANRSAFHNFSYLKSSLESMEKQILVSKQELVMQSLNLPSEPILTELIYKNTDTLYYKILKRGFSVSISKNVVPINVQELMQLPEISSRQVVLPKADDFNTHALFFKLDGLPVGYYEIIFSDKKIEKENLNLRRVRFTVTALQMTSNAGQVYVLDRKTGAPVIKAKLVEATKPLQRMNVSKAGVFHETNSLGFARIRNKTVDTVLVYYKGDSIVTHINTEQRDVDSDAGLDVFDKNEYDDLVEYYEDNAEAYIYTDRSIYRPGQTVFYKMILLTKNRKTGESIIMNARNMQKSVFSNIYKKWQKKSDLDLYISDPFDKIMDSVKIQPDEFGCITGSFRIPKTAATGEWSIQPDYLEMPRWRMGSFRVEEYKRPTYEVVIDKPKKELDLGDTIYFNIKVKSFAGALLNNVTVHYWINRAADISQKNWSGSRFIHPDTLLIKDVGVTNNKGELKIAVTDTSLLYYRLDSLAVLSFKYDLDIEVRDPTGEVYEAGQTVTVSSRPIDILLPNQRIYKRGETKNIIIKARHENADDVSKSINIKVFREEPSSKLYSSRELITTDQWLYNRDDLKAQFPIIAFSEPVAKQKHLLFETSITTKTAQRLHLDSSLFDAGVYIIEAVCLENGLIKGRVEKKIKLFDTQNQLLPFKTDQFSHLPINSVKPNTEITYYMGNTEADVYNILHVKYFSSNKKKQIKNIYLSGWQKKGLREWKWIVPTDAVDQVAITQTYMLNNEVYSKKETIYVQSAIVKEPKIIIERYRTKLVPGTKETFAVSIKTGNEDIAAELMTTMYDASLDKLEPHTWETPSIQSRRSLIVNWGNQSNFFTTNTPIYLSIFSINVDKIDSSRALWWLNPEDYHYGNTIFKTTYNHAIEDREFSAYSFLQGRVSGLALQEVVVIGYARKTMSLSSSLIQIRGLTSLKLASAPLIVLDGVLFAGDLSSIDMNLITDIQVLKGADAVGLYGAKAAEGVVVLSTNGQIDFSRKLKEFELPPRKNFQETAFFFSSIHANKEGYYSFTFTMPESVTEWNWKMLAHTKNAMFAYAERKLKTRLPLMVQPNMPRLLYQGDSLVLQNRISNLDTINIAGKATCKIENAITGEDITTSLVEEQNKDFSILSGQSATVPFQVKVPIDLLHPIKIKISAITPGFSDGEEHIIPIYSTASLTNQLQVVRFAGNDTVVIPANLPSDAKMYGIGLSILPKPQSAIINGLAYLTNFAYDCAEQLVNKVNASIYAIQIMRSDSSAQKAFKNINSKIVEANLTNNQSLSNEQIEQSMPWLGLNEQAIQNRKRIYTLLDTVTRYKDIEKNLGKLYALQNIDGGLSWFGGGNSNLYISQYVLASFGRLRILSLESYKNNFTSTFQNFIQRLVLYGDKNIAANNQKNESIGFLELVKARSYWSDTYPLSDSLQSTIKSGVHEHWKNANSYSLHDKVLLSMVSIIYFKTNDEVYNMAIKLLRSIRALAIEDENNGMRWKAIADADDLSIAAEETVAIIVEAFELAGFDNNQLIQKGITKWLLNAKQEHHWQTTKGTAAAITMLRDTEETIIDNPLQLSVEIEGKELQVSNDMLNGNLSAFELLTTEVEKKVKLTKKDNRPVAGNIVWYYFSNSREGNPQKDISIEKQISRFNNKLGIWESVEESTVLQIADRIKVKLTIQTVKALRYIFIDDKRAASLEPIDNLSEYKYSTFGYYQSIKDAGIQLFADVIPSGKHEITYELKVAHTGSFTNGRASLQCMYRPEISTYSNSIRIQSE